MKGNLNVSVLCNELYVLIQAPQDASNHTLESFVNSILFVANLLILVNNILKDQSDESNECYEEGTHSNRATMVPDSPLERSADTDLTSGIRHLLALSREVPHAS